MPTLNIYFCKEEKEKELEQLSIKLKSFVVKELSGEDIALTPEEISIRLIPVKGMYMIGDIEVEIKAHAFPDRVKKQDEICNTIRKFIEEEYSTAGKVRVWLQLSELGHSW